MIPGTSTSRRDTRKRRQPARWPRLRFFVTLLFFVLIAASVLNGSTCTISVAGLEISCPLGVVQVMLAAQKVIFPLLIAGLLGVLLLVIFGRAFCSWICPGRWIFNQAPVKNPKLRRFRTWMQRAVLGGVVGAAWMCHTPVFCAICPAGVACRGAIAAGTGGSLLPTVGWLGALIGLEWGTGLSFCRDLCPLGTTFTWLSRLNPFFKLRADPAKCVPCQACAKACPEGLNLSQDVNLAACTKCFACQEACPRGAVELQVFSKPTVVIPQDIEVRAPKQQQP